MQKPEFKIISHEYFVIESAKFILSIYNTSQKQRRQENVSSFTFNFIYQFNYGN